MPGQLSLSENVSKLQMPDSSQERRARRLKKCLSKLKRHKIYQKDKKPFSQWTK